MKPKIHELKTWPVYYHEVFMGHKTFEVRLNDRNFQVGDYVNLKEWNPETKEYTGKELVRRVTSKLDGGNFGVQNGFVVLSIQ